jgi:hypothetical protein
VKDQTGFQSMSGLLGFAAIVCDGNIYEITKTRTKLTWFEEQFFFFEKIWGRTARRWKDSIDKYGRGEIMLIDLLDEKLQMVMLSRERWPTYATIKEDESLRRDQWNVSYAGKRVVQWDNTSLRKEIRTQPTM